MLLSQQSRCLVRNTANVTRRCRQACLRPASGVFRGFKRHAVDFKASSGNHLTASDDGSSKDTEARHKEAEMNAQITSIALPMLVTLAADPLAGLVETAFIGRLGAVELAGMAVGLSIFSTITKFLNIPLISSTTTAVARATGSSKPKQAAGSSKIGQQLADSSSSSDPHHAVSSSAASPEPCASSSSPSESSTSGAASHSSAAGSSPASSSSAESSSSSRGGSSDRGNKGTSTASRDGTPEPPSPFNPDGFVALPPSRHALRSSMDSSGEQGGEGAVGVGVGEHGGQQSPVSVAASSAILLAAVIGCLEVLFVCVGASSALRLWGVTSSASGDMYRPALDFLRIRALGAPVQVLMLTLQGVFRGLQDAQTPLQCSLASNFLNVLLAPLLIFWAGWGVKGAAAAIVIAQALPTLYLLHVLSKRVVLRLTSQETLIQLTKLAGPSGWLMIRSLGSTWTYALATATVARAGATHAAAHQVCFQLWMATTLTADAVAVAVQSLLAKSMAQGDVPASRRLVERCITIGVGMGCVMALAVGTFRHALAKVFTTDPFVLSLIASIMPVLIITQPINALAFVADGALFGVGGFKFASASMALAALPSLALIAFGSSQVDHAVLVYVWLGLGLLMSVRAVSITIAYLLKRGPFRELSLPSDLGDRGNGKRGWVLTWDRFRLKLL